MACALSELLSNQLRSMQYRVVLRRPPCRGPSARIAPASSRLRRIFWTPRREKEVRSARVFTLGQAFLLSGSAYQHNSFRTALTEGRTLLQQEAALYASLLTARPPELLASSLLMWTAPVYTGHTATRFAFSTVLRGRHPDLGIDIDHTRKNPRNPSKSGCNSECNDLLREHH